MELTETDLQEIRARAEISGSFTRAEINALCDGYAPAQIPPLKRGIEDAEQRFRDERSLHLDKNDRIRQLEERVQLITDQLQGVLGAGQHARSS